jgi:hypothetical protein
MTLRTSSFLLIPFLQACATATGSFMPLGSNHPASPQAAELAIPDPSACLNGDGGDGLSIDPSAAPPDDPLATAPIGAFACPMHHEVSSDSPGTCPKYGMKLVPRESIEQREEHVHDH